MNAEPQFGGERQLLASILQNALDDCRTGEASYAIPAWHWIHGPNEWLTKYCDLLDINTERFRKAVGEQCGARCLEFIRLREIEAEKAREEAEQKKRYEEQKHADAKRRKERRGFQARLGEDPLRTTPA